MTMGWEIKETLDHALDAVIDDGEGRTDLTTVIDLSEGEAEVLRVGAGGPARVELPGRAAPHAGRADLKPCWRVGCCSSPAGCRCRASRTSCSRPR
jgi:hypothetical protein